MPVTPSTSQSWDRPQGVTTRTPSSHSSSDLQDWPSGPCHPIRREALENRYDGSPWAGSGVSRAEPGLSQETGSFLGKQVFPGLSEQEQEQLQPPDGPFTRGTDDTDYKALFPT